jgi:ribosomal protein L37AE/L43A
MARGSTHSTSASLGLKTMLRTIQCPGCGVVLNVPESAAGRRLKCPHCTHKFAAPADLAAGSSPTPARGPGSSGSLNLPTSLGGASGTFELPISPGPLRDTLDLPLLSDDPPRSVPRKGPPASGPTTADALALFQDEPKTARKPRGAEARATTRRCPSCGGVVGVGMSLCNTCGLDLDTGQRVAPMEVFEDDMPAMTRPAVPSIGVVFVGSLCATGNLLLAVASLVAWKNGQEGAEFLLIVWLFGIFGSVQFLRRKTIRPLFISLSLAVGIGVVYLIALPIYNANITTGAAPIVENGPGPGEDPDGSRIRPITEQLDMNKISWGVFSLLAYAGLAVYLNSPAMHRDFKR